MEFSTAYFIFLKILFIFRQRGREGEKYHCVVAPRTPPTDDLACNPGMCPDWEVNQQPFGLQASTQTTEPSIPARAAYFNKTKWYQKKKKKTQRNKWNK